MLHVIMVIYSLVLRKSPTQPPASAVIALGEKHRNVRLIERVLSDIQVSIVNQAEMINVNVGSVSL